MSTEPTTQPPAYLKEILRELLVLQGMDRHLGFYRQTDAAVSAPDPMFQAKRYLSGYQPRFQQIFWTRSLWTRLSYIAMILVLVIIQFQNSGLFINIIIGCVLFMSLPVSKNLEQRNRDFFDKLSDSSVYDKWFHCLQNPTESIDTIYKYTNPFIAWFVLV